MNRFSRHWPSVLVIMVLLFAIEEVVPAEAQLPGDVDKQKSAVTPPEKTGEGASTDQDSNRLEWGRGKGQMEEPFEAKVPAENDSEEPGLPAGLPGAHEQMDIRTCQGISVEPTRCRNQ